MDPNKTLVVYLANNYSSGTEKVFKQEKKLSSVRWVGVGGYVYLESHK